VDKGLSEIEINFNAAEYAIKDTLIAYIKERGRLQDRIESGGFSIAMTKIIEWCSKDLILTEKETDIKGDGRLFEGG